MTWPALHATSLPPLQPPTPEPPIAAKHWQALRRHQRPDDALAGTFNAGAASISWLESDLIVDFVFAGTHARNRARQLNERTHELGDVGEIFLHCNGVEHYIEIHVTPENQRLQLRWTEDGVAAVRKGRAKLEDCMVPDPDWVQSITAVAPSFWSARTIVPASLLLPAGGMFERTTQLRASICRYDTSDGSTPVLSATADYKGGRFHDRAAWHDVVLLT
jgi:hypothetical protein